MPEVKVPNQARRDVLALLGILVVCALAYARLGSNGFINWDDPVWVIENPVFSAPHPLRAIWFTLETHQYYPLYFSMLWVEHLLFGADAAGYHWVSLAQHLLAVAGLFALLRRLGFGRMVASLAALFFGLHPMQVAAVAWATEQKTLLSTALVFWSFERYLAWQETRSGYAASLVLFAAAMLTKSQPLLLLALFPLARPLLERRSLVAALRAEWPRLVPFAAVALLLAVPTVIRERSPLDEGNLSLLERAIVMGRGLAFYLAKIVWPQPLSGLYSLWRVDPRETLLLLWPLLGLAIVAVAFLLARRVRAIAVMALLFVLPWLPASGLVPFGHMEKSYVADHLIYASLAGFALAFGAFVELVTSRRLLNGALRTPGLALAVVVLLGAGSATFARTFAYADSFHFWTAVLVVDPDSPSANNNLGSALFEQGRIDEAIERFERTLRVKPSNYEARMNYAHALERKGDREGEIRELREALRAKPGDSAATAVLSRLGALDLDPGREAALREKAEQEPSDRVEATIALARFLTDSGRGEEAEALLSRALTRALAAPMRAAALSEFGYVSVSLKHYEAALAAYREQSTLQPDVATVRMNHGVMLRRLGRFDEAVTELTRAAELDPSNDQIRANLEKARRGQR